jgi:hypothetical protein
MHLGGKKGLVADHSLLFDEASGSSMELRKSTSLLCKTTRRSWKSRRVGPFVHIPSDSRRLTSKLMILYCFRNSFF